MCLDFSIGSFCKSQFFSRTHGQLYRMTYSIDSTREDILLFGSSRSNHHYLPNIFEDSLNLSCYNTGKEGCFIYYQLAVLNSVIKRYSPKIIVLDITPYDFLTIDNTNDRLGCLLPYYALHPEIKTLINQHHDFEPLKNISKIYPFNNLAFHFGRKNFERMRQEIENKGFEDSDAYSIWDKPKKKEDEKVNPFLYDTTKVNAFSDFISICKNQNINLFITVSPYYRDLNVHNQKMIRKMEEISHSSNIKFFNFSQDTTFINHNYLFFDEDHLNGEGAKLLSSIVAGKIRSDFIKQNED